MSALLESAQHEHQRGLSGSALARLSGPRIRSLLWSAPAIVALVSWRLSLVHVNVGNLTDYGLPPALPLGWYLALAVGVLGTIGATTARRVSPAIMFLYLVVVIFVLYGTVPVLSAQPHYAWVYKHIGVVRYLEIHGRVDTHVDIYNRWPGFFALGAVFSSVVGRANPESYAGWAELFFLLFDAVAVIVAIKVVTRNARIAVAGALFFVLTNWVGQTYYSPQAFAFLLGLVLLSILLRQLGSPAGYSRRLGRWLEKIFRRRQLPPESDDIVRWPRWAAIVSVLALDAVIVASHQLTPYMLLVSVALLMLSGIVRPWWVLLAMAAMTFAYLAINFGFIQRHYGLFTSIDPFNNLYVEKYPSVPTAGKDFNTHVQLLLIAAELGVALVCTVRLLLRGLLLRALPFVVLAIAPFALVFGQNYGGEASLRIILFSSPWTGALSAWGLATLDRPRLKWALATTIAVVFAALFVPSFLGQEELNIVSPSEVQASEYFYSHGRAGAVLVLGAPGFPYRYGGTYPNYSGPEGDANPNLLTNRGFQGRQLGAAEIPGIVRRITEYSHRGYVAFTKDEARYAEVLGVTPPRALYHLEAAVEKSPYFRLWYSSGDAKIFELIAGPWVTSAEAVAEAKNNPLRLSPSALSKARATVSVRSAHDHARRGATPKEHRVNNNTTRHCAQEIIVHFARVCRREPTPSRPIANLGS